MITCPDQPAIRRSILRLPTSSIRSPSTTASTRPPKMYSAVPTPPRMSPIVKRRSRVDIGSISPYPTVEMVVTVWYSAFIGEKPSSR